MTSVLDQAQLSSVVDRRNKPDVVTTDVNGGNCNIERNGSRTVRPMPCPKGSIGLEEIFPVIFWRREDDGKRELKSV